MHVSSCATILRSISRCADSRRGAIASISSMKTTHGASAAADANRPLMMASDSPDTPATTSGAATRRKGTPALRATACASAVLPHPGGPCSRSPRGGSTPSQA